jgi:hypothetical protein
MNRPKFALDQLAATPGAIEALEKRGQTPNYFLTRQAAGDWGDVDEEDWALNDQTLLDGSQVVSAYTLRTGMKIWVLTEADRTVTTLLLPSDY